MRKLGMFVTLIGISVVFLVGTTVYAEVVAEYTFTSGTTTKSSDTDPYTTASDHYHTVGGYDFANGNKYADALDVNGGTLSAIITADKYDSIDLTIPAGVTIDPGVFVYDYIMENGYQDFTSYLLYDDEGDGFDVGDELGHVTLTAATMNDSVTNLANSIDISSIGSLSGTNMELRLYFTDNSGSNTRLHRVDNISVAGTISVTIVAEYTFTSGTTTKSSDTEPYTTASDHYHTVGGYDFANGNKYANALDVNAATLSAIITADKYDSIDLTIPVGITFDPGVLIYDYIMENGFENFTSYLLYDDEGDGFDAGDELGHVTLTAVTMNDSVTNLANSIDISSIGSLSGTNMELRLYFTDNSGSSTRFHRVDNIRTIGRIITPPDGTLIIVQ